MEASKGESPLEMAKRLVRAVARAFYDDAVVAVLDALLRDRHLRDADMDQRMGGLSHKMVRRVLGELLEERLIKTEEVLDEASGRRDLYYYIDFGHFTNVVRYRVHLMHRELERMEREANDNQTYECPDCGRSLSVLEAQPLRNQRFGFCCPTCCPNETHHGCAGDRWQLRPKQVVAGFEEVQALKDKLRRQMYAASEADDGPAPHDGIYNLLSALERQALPSNLPSELIAVGVAEGGDGGARRRGGGGGGGGGRGGGGAGGGAGIFEDLAAATRDGGIHADADGEDGGGEGGGSAFLNLVRPARAQPEFLRGSRVIQDDHEGPSPTKTGAGATASGGAVAAGVAAGEPAEALTEAQRIEAYKQAYMAALQKELAAGGGGAGVGAGAGAGAGATGATAAAAAAEEEDEDVDWEEGE